MYFSTAIVALASATIASAAKVSFWTLDGVQRTVYFTGSSNIDPVVVNGDKRVSVEFPDVYQGNFYAVKDGAENVPGMLGEVNFSGWDGLTYFDVSAIVDPTDTDNIKQMWPAGIRTPMSGCESFPCDNAYWHPDDVQTKATDSTHIVVSLGSGSTGFDFQ